jgi:hypothetical protein
MRLSQRMKIVGLLALVPAFLVGLSLCYGFARGSVAVPNMRTDQDLNSVSNHNLQQVEDGVPTVGSVEFKKLLKVLGLAMISQGTDRHR